MKQRESSGESHRFLLMGKDGCQCRFTEMERGQGLREKIMRASSLKAFDLPKRDVKLAVG